jgi:hypothetical protein
MKSKCKTPFELFSLMSPLDEKESKSHAFVDLKKTFFLFNVDFFSKLRYQKKIIVTQIDGIFLEIFFSWMCEFLLSHLLFNLTLSFYLFFSLFYFFKLFLLLLLKLFCESTLQRDLVTKFTWHF